jgi:hypothetical protein
LKKIYRQNHDSKIIKNTRRDRMVQSFFDKMITDRIIFKIFATVPSIYWKRKEKVPILGFKQKGWVELIGKFLYHAFRQVFIDFPMSWHRLRHSRFRILIPFLFSAMPNEHASRFLQPSNQIAPFHARTSSPSCRIPGISPPVRSAPRSLRCSFKSSREVPCVT